MQANHSTDTAAPTRTRTDFGTFVFFDLETTGLPPNAEITEISLTAVARDAFDKFCTSPTASETSCALPRPLQTLTLQCRPTTIDSTSAWQMYDSGSAARCSGLTSEHLSTIATFGSAYPLLRSFLQHLPPPLCFVAHNGFRFDYVVWSQEVVRQQLPELGVECHAVDSLNAFRFLDQQYIREIHLAVRPPSTPSRAGDASNATSASAGNAASNVSRDPSSELSFATPSASATSSAVPSASSTPKRNIYKVWMDGQLVQDDTTTPAATPSIANGDSSELHSSRVKRKLFPEDGVKDEPMEDTSHAQTGTTAAAPASVMDNIKQEISVKLEPPSNDSDISVTPEKMCVDIDDADAEFEAMNNAPAAAAAGPTAKLPDRKDWSPAKCTVADRGQFKLGSDGMYNFVSGPTGSYSLGTLWNAHFGARVTQPLAHSAQGDVQMMLMLAGAHGKAFTEYCATNATPLNLNSSQTLNSLIGQK